MLPQTNATYQQLGYILAFSAIHSVNQHLECILSHSRNLHHLSLTARTYRPDPDELRN